jgi:hypothetical protein
MTPKFDFNTVWFGVAVEAGGEVLAVVGVEDEAVVETADAEGEPPLTSGGAHEATRRARSASVTRLAIELSVSHSSVPTEDPRSSPAGPAGI